MLLSTFSKTFYGVNTMIDFIIALFLIVTSAVIGLLSVMSLAAGVPGMGWVALGCVACFVGGWAIIATELS
jgi:hypothetical protein